MPPPGPEKALPGISLLSWLVSHDDLDPAHGAAAEGLVGLASDLLPQEPRLADPRSRGHSDGEHAVVERKGAVTAGAAHRRSRASATLAGRRHAPAEHPLAQEPIDDLAERETTSPREQAYRPPTLASGMGPPSPGPLTRLGVTAPARTSHTGRRSTASASSATEMNLAPGAPSAARRTGPVGWGPAR